MIRSQKERHYRCKSGGQTFYATKGRPLIRAHKPHDLVVNPVTLLSGIRLPASGHSRGLFYGRGYRLSPLTRERAVALWRVYEHSTFRLEGRS